MRIAHVISTPTGFGGAERTLAQLVAYGARDGYTQLVLNPFATDPADPAAPGFYAPADYAGHTCTRVRELPALRRWVARRLAEFRPDVVHAHLYHAGVLVATLRRPQSARFVLSHQHGDHFQHIGSRRGEFIDRLAGMRFDRVVGCSRYVERWLADRYGYRPARLTSVRNGWSGRPVARHENGAPPTVICVARLRAQKNHRMLIDAFAAVRESVPDARLRLVGDGDEHAALAAEIAGAGLTESVDLVGATENIWPLLAEAHVFALASSYEPLGIAALEAMAAGLPVVATAVGGLPEIVRDGVTGFLVTPGDKEAMAEAIKRLLADGSLRLRMGAAAQALAAENHAERMAAGYGVIYEQLLGEQP